MTNTDKVFSMVGIANELFEENADFFNKVREIANGARGRVVVGEMFEIYPAQHVFENYDLRFGRVGYELFQLVTSEKGLSIYSRCNDFMRVYNSNDGFNEDCPVFLLKELAGIIDDCKEMVMDY